jgi:hypothetical protein
MCFSRWLMSRGRLGELAFMGQCLCAAIIIKPRMAQNSNIISK